jgi:hypothetical protein
LLLASVTTTVAKPGDEADQPEVPAAEKLDSQPSETPAPSPPIAPKRGSDLPWVKNKGPKDAITVIRPPSSVREILEKYDIGESQLDGFFNTQPLTVAEEEVIVRILYRLPRIGLENIQKWRKPDVDFATLLNDAKTHRLDVIPLKGRLIGVEKREVSPELASRLEIKHFYLARIDLTGLGYEALVAVRRLPKAWEEATELDEPVSLDGIFLKAGELRDNQPQLIFVARRVRWHPDREIPELYIGPDQLRLAELGLDLSLLEDLRLLNKRELGDFDREPMYQLLDVAGRAPAGKLRSEPRKELDLIPLLTEPEKHQGELMTVEGFARRITKVVVDDPDIRARFGIDHYYMIDMAVNLKDKTIRVVNDAKKEKPNTEDGSSAGKKEEKQEVEEGPVFNNDYPVTLCVRELPADLPPKDAMRDLIRADGIFMKTWSYRNAYMAKFDNKFQVAPLLIGKSAHRLVPAQVHNWVSDTLVGFALALAAILIGCVFWWFRTGDKKMDETLAKLDERTPAPSFEGLENAPTKPDFSGLEQAGEAPKAID